MLKSDNGVICPKQPFFVLAVNKYYKVPINQYGISHFFCYKTNLAESVIEIVPDACVTLYFYCKPDNPVAFFHGAVTHPSEMYLPESTYVFGVRFQPCFNPISHSKLDFSSYNNSIVPFNSTLRSQKLIGKIAASTDFISQIELFMGEYLIEYTKIDIEDYHHSLINYISNQILISGGNIKLQNIAEESGYSARYLNKIFVNHIGIPPKLYSRVIRFQQTISALSLLGGIEYSEYAVQLGYSDQSHMIREFREFSATTPKKYVKTLEDSHYQQKLIIMQNLRDINQISGLNSIKCSILLPSTL